MRLPRLLPEVLRIFDFTGGFSPAMSFQIVERQRPVTGHFAGGLGNRRYSGMIWASQCDAMTDPRGAVFEWFIFCFRREANFSYNLSCNR